VLRDVRSWGGWGLPAVIAPAEAALSAPFFAQRAGLDAGESIKALSEYLGHHDPGFTLRTYTHLTPSSGTRTRAAVDRVFRDGEPADDGPETAQGSEWGADPRLSQ
jgi:hypothetical protein